MSAAEIASVSGEFDIFAHRPIQTSVLGTIERAYKPIATVDQKDLEIFISADNDTIIDLDIKLNVRGKLIAAKGKDVDFTDHMDVTNNFLRFLFSQSNITLNCVTITQGSVHYHYHSYLETLMTYGTDAAPIHLSSAYCYLDTDPSTENLTATTNRVFITLWNRLCTSTEFQLLGRLHSNIFNVPLYLMPGVRLQIWLTKT